MPDTFGERLRKARILQGFKQYELAEKAGISSSHLGMIERNEVAPTITTLEWICKALNVGSAELLGF